MPEIARHLAISLDAVVYFMRKHKLSRRSFSEINRLRFESKKPSFKVRKLSNERLRELRAIGVMLYWGEGSKGNDLSRYGVVDFANSDPYMIELFLVFLRKIYIINENKLRVLLYCYSDQNIESLINFWSKLTKISKGQFTKPYVRKDFRKDGRKMKYGLVHIRYGDKKLLLEFKKLIGYYQAKYRVGTEVVKRDAL